jgi:predicted RNase H-like HicB family nuclease
MQNTYTAIVKNDGDWWIGWIEEIPGVNCQERTKDELMETLKITLKEALEFNRLDALEAAKSEYHEEMVQICEAERAASHRKRKLIPPAKPGRIPEKIIIKAIEVVMAERSTH